MRKTSAALFLLAVLAAGCGGSSSSSSKEGGHVQDRHELADRLAQPVRRLQPGRVLDVRVHLPDPHPVRQGERQVHPRLREVVVDLDRRQDLDVQDASTDAKWSDGQPLTAEDAAWTINTDIKYKSTGAANDAGLIAHITRAEAPDPDTLVVHYAAPPGTCSGSSSSSRSCRSTSGRQHTGQQGQRPEDVPEQRADRRRGPVQPDQVPEEPDRALPAERQLLRAEAEDRRVRPADVLERRRARLGAQVARDRRDRRVPATAIKTLKKRGLRRHRRAGPRPDRLHHQLEPEEDEATASC